MARRASALTQPGVAERASRLGTAPRHKTCTPRAPQGEDFDDFDDRETDDLAALRGRPAPRPSRRRSGASRVRHRSEGCGRPAGPEGPDRVVRAGPDLLLVLRDRVPQVATRRPELVGQQHGRLLRPDRHQPGRPGGPRHLRDGLRRGADGGQMLQKPVPRLHQEPGLRFGRALYPAEQQYRRPALLHLRQRQADPLHELPAGRVHVALQRRCRDGVGSLQRRRESHGEEMQWDQLRQGRYRRELLPRVHGPRGDRRADRRVLLPVPAAELGSVRLRAHAPELQLGHGLQRPESVHRGQVRERYGRCEILRQRPRERGNGMPSLGGPL